MNRVLSIAVVSLLSCGYAIAESPAAGTWNQWRGPDRTGTIFLAEWPETVDSEAVSELWRVPLGSSYSGPIVDEKHVYLTETVDEKTEAVIALDRSTGNKVWRQEWVGGLKVPFFAAANGSWIRATPALSDGKLFVAGMSDMLACFDADTGNQIWLLDMPKKLGTSPPSFGFASSPLVDNGSVYVQAGGGLMKLDAATGDIVWHVLKDGGGMGGSAFSSPVIETLQDVRQLVVQTRTRLVGIDIESGNELWGTDIPAFRGMNILTPLIIGDSVFTSSYGGGSFLFDISRTESGFAATERWSNKREGYMSSPVVVDGSIYLHMKNQRFTCIDVASGEERWATRPFGKYWSMIANGSQILALDERGDLRLIDANPKQFDVASEQKISNSPTWAHLAIVGDELFVRELDAIAAYRWK